MTKSGAGSNCDQYERRRELRHVAANLGRMGTHLRCTQGFGISLDCIEIGRERRLRIDDDPAASGELTRSCRDEAARPRHGVFAARKNRSARTMPAISTVRRRCISPQRPRVAGARKAFTRLPVSACRCFCVSASDFTCS